MNALQKQETFRVFDTGYKKNNIYRYQVGRTISLGPVMIATVADKYLPWLSAEVISENNYHDQRFRAPVDKYGFPDHFKLQQEKYARFVGLALSITTSAPRAIATSLAYHQMPEELTPDRILIGGWHASDTEKELLLTGEKGVVVHGEGEKAIVEVLEALYNGKSLEDIPCISYWDNGEIKRNGRGSAVVPQDQMDNLPNPNFGLVKYSKIKIFPLQRTRGCSGKCEFCRVKNSNPRTISPGRFLEQVRMVIHLGSRDIFLTDDRPEENLDEFVEVLEGQIRVQEDLNVELNMTIQCRVSLAEHRDIVKIMSRAGIKRVCVGVESPIVQELESMSKPTKNLSPSEVAGLIDVFKQNGLFVHLMMIFGYPQFKGSLVDDQGELITVAKRGDIFWNFIKKAKPDTLQLLMYTPIPGTNDWYRLRNQNRLLPRKDFGWELYDGTHLVFKPDPGIDPRELQDEATKINRKFYMFGYLWRLCHVSLAIRAFWLVFFATLAGITWLLKWITRKLRMMFISNRLDFVWRRLRHFRENATMRLGGVKIILDWMDNFKKSSFREKLERLANKKY